MRHRIFRSAIGLAAVLVAYSAYALVAVPLIEPAARQKAGGAASPGQVAMARAGNARYAKLFERYFPPDHWAHDNPKVLESGQAMLLLKDYRSLGGGRMELIPCVVLIFPEEKDPQNAGRGAIILDAPQGAVLQFDKDFDLAQARLGKLRHGKLVGPITVHSDMREPGPEDDLRIVTRDVQMTQSRVWTDAHVEFRLGASRGQGEQMEIRLLPGDSNNATGVNIGGLQSFQLARDVKTHLEMEQPGLLPGGEKQAADPNEKPQPPVEITCQGPFHFDMTRYVATFEDQVDVLRLNPDGPSDQLTCELLSIYFQPKENTATADKNEPLPKLRPARIEARGDPVVVRSPSTVGEARCQRLEYDLITRKISLEGDDRVMLRQGPSQVWCAAVHYQPSADPNRLGTLWAKGPGELQVVSEKDPSQAFKAYWQRELHLRRYQGAPVVSLLGRPRLEAAGNGSLTADEVHLWLLEPPPGATPQGPATQSSQVQPDRMLAQGNVRIESPQLTGDTKRLEVWFRQAVGGTGLAARAKANRQDAPPQSLASPRGHLAPPPLLPTTREQAPPKQTFAVEGDLVRMQLLMRGRAADLSDLTIDGHVVLRETRTAKPGEKPLVIRGDRLQMTGAEDQLAHVTVNGQPARVEARGMTMQGAAIDLDQESNRLWINGAGSLSMPVSQARRAGGVSPLMDEGRMTVTWQGQMQFDGRTAQFQRQVVGRGPLQILHTELLEAELKTPIRFTAGGPRPGGTGPELLEVRCRQGLRLENCELEGGRQTSIDRMELASLRINRATGEIAGEGPGWLTTVRVGGGNPLAGPAAPKPSSPAGSGLVYLRVDFTRALTGNIHRRQVSFIGNVRSVYGPVPNWSQVVDVNGPAGLGKQGVLLDCDRLTVTEMNSPARRQNHLELEAIGNTLVEGSEFTARAHRMAYTQAKELLVLEGSAHTDAQLWRQTQIGGPSSHAAARKILYWRATNRVEVDDARYLDLSQFGGE